MPSNAHANPHPEMGTELIREWVPQGKPRAHIVLVHGLAEHSGRYERTGTLLADAGFYVRAFDLLGAGGSGGRRWHTDEWSRYHDQVQSHLEWARSRGGPIVLMGHSLGGAICLGYLIDERPQPDLAILSAPALSGGSSWQRPLASILGRLTPKLTIPNPVNGEHLSRDPNVAEAYFADPLVITKSTCGFGSAAFEEIDRLVEEHHRLAVPTLVIHGGEDVLVPTRSSEILAELPNVDRKVYEGLRHETLNEPEGPEVVADIVSWLNEKLAGL